MPAIAAALGLQESPSTAPDALMRGYAPLPKPR
jgi:hypothetical protein